MSGWNISNNNLSKVIAQNAAADLRAANEYNFNVLQNTIIRRMNEEIGRLNDDTDLDRRLAEYNKEIAALSKQAPKINKYIFNNQSNSLRLAKLLGPAAELRATLLSNAGDGNVSAEEAANFEADKKSVIETLHRLVELNYEGVYDSNPIDPLHDLAKDLENLTATEGVIDAEDSDTKTNDNRDLVNTLDRLQDQIKTSLLVTNNTIKLSRKLSRSIQSKISLTDAERVQVTAVDAKRKTEAINDLRNRNATLLKAISLSFDMAAQQIDAFAEQMGPQSPPPGSALNMFV